MNGDLGETEIVSQTAEADPAGSLNLSIGGELTGAGEFAYDVYPYLETEWTAPNSGEYTITASYDVQGIGRQIANDEGGASVLTVLESDLSVNDADETVLVEKSTRDHLARNVNRLPELLETLVVNYVLLKGASVVGGIFGKLVAWLARPLVADLFDDIIDQEGRQEKRILEDGILRATFLAREGHTYRIRFLSNGSFLGRSMLFTSGFQTEMTARYSLNDFVIRSGSPDGTEDEGETRSENVLTVTKSGKEGNTAFMVIADGEIVHGDGSEAVISGKSALDVVGPKSGTDELRFAGDIENFLLKGDATVHLNGEEVDPGELGRTEHLANTLIVESTGEQAGFYGVTVSGTIVGGEKGFSEGFVRGSSAIDWVGDKSGTDRYRYSGEILDFLLKGDANVYVNGEQVDPDTLGI